MSDFDAVLERLLSDPSFKSALAANPDAALSGYRLEAEERDLLCVQVSSDPGEERTVELRTSKSGVVGLLGPVASMFGVATGGQTLGSAPGSGTFGSAPAGTQSLGDGDTSTQSFGEVEPTEDMGTAAENPETMGPALTEAADYHTRVDVDGDPGWDAHTAYERSDGGVDIHADINNDGVVDFIGHDYDRDGLVDVAEFDNDLDGVMDTRMYDDSGDGWMDRAAPIADVSAEQSDEAQSFGQAPAAS